MSDSNAPAALKTPLYDLHCRHDGKMVDFAGYLLPLSYAGGGLLAEHLHTREAASLFDVSHMGQVVIANDAAATAALAQLVPANVEAIPAGSAKYTVLTTPEGGVIDDCIITNDGDDGWFVVINASRKAVDLAHLRAALSAAGAGDALREIDDHALLAVQGPQAAALVAALFPDSPEIPALKFMQCAHADSPFGRCRVSRCGYTGEDGFEISVPAGNSTALAEALLAGGVCKPAGLGARDSLRLEAGLCLYGNELDEATSPIEAGLLWAIPKSRRGADAAYPGAAAIAAQIADGAPRRLVGLLPQSKTPVRGGAPLQHDGSEVGRVTSGVHSPTLSAPVAIALVAAQVPADATLSATVRGRDIPCQQTALPFVPHNYYRG